MRWASISPAPGARPADEHARPDTERARDLLTPFEFARYDSGRPDAARAFLVGRLLLRDLVATLVAVDPAEIWIEARCPVCGGAHGRPVVVAPAAATRLRLGLAHSGSVVVAAASWDRPVGVDVERADAQHTPERDKAIAAVAGASGDDALEHWTRVEAVLKADGRGLRVDPRRVHIRTADDVVEARIDSDEVTGADANRGFDDDANRVDSRPRYRLASIDLGAGFTATVAVALTN